MDVNSEENSVYYFAYGSNMLYERMNDRVGSLGKFECLGHYHLDGWGFRFSLLQPTTGEPEQFVGYATVIRSPEDRVHGVVYKLFAPKEQIQKLDECEETSEGYYKRIQVLVSSAADSSVKIAQVYVGNIREEFYAPTDVYRNICIKGANANGVPINHLLKK